MKKKYILLTVLILFFAICTIINYEHTLEIKKQFGANLDRQFYSMQSNAEGLKMYIEKSPVIDNLQLSKFTGQLYSDRSLYGIYVVTDKTVYSHFTALENYIDLAVKTNDISKVKPSIIHELDEIIAFSSNLKIQCANKGDFYLNWYNLYAEHKFE